MSEMVKRILASRKAMMVLLVMSASFAALFAGKIQWDQVESLMKWLLGTWILAQGAEDTVRNLKSQP